MKEKEQAKKVGREKFQISGKIKPEEEFESLEGFKVMAYVAGTKKLLGSALTDADGAYKIQLEHDEPVDVNISICPDTNEETLRVIPKARYLISKDEWMEKGPLGLEVDIPLPETTTLLWERVWRGYTIYGMVVKGIPDPVNPGNYLGLVPIPGATVHIFDVSKPPFVPYLSALGIPRSPDIPRSPEIPPKPPEIHPGLQRPHLNTFLRKLALPPQMRMDYSRTVLSGIIPSCFQVTLNRIYYSRSLKLWIMLMYSSMRKIQVKHDGT